MERRQQGRKDEWRTNHGNTHSEEKQRTIEAAKEQKIKQNLRLSWERRKWFVMNSNKRRLNERDWTYFCSATSPHFARLHFAGAHFFQLLECLQWSVAVSDLSTVSNIPTWFYRLQPQRIWGTTRALNLVCRASQWIPCRLSRKRLLVSALLQCGGIICGPLMEHSEWKGSPLHSPDPAHCQINHCWKRDAR